MTTQNAVLNMIKERQSKIKQLAVIQSTEREKLDTVARLDESLQLAKKAHDARMFSNLTGGVSDQDLKGSKASLKESIDSLQEAMEVVKFIKESMRKLNNDIGMLNGDIAVHRGALCSKLADAAYSSMAADKKLKEKLISGYSAFQRTGDYDMSWQRFLVLCFPQPSDSDLQLATEKLRASNDFMRD